MWQMVSGVGSDSKASVSGAVHSTTRMRSAQPPGGAAVMAAEGSGENGGGRQTRRGALASAEQVHARARERAACVTAESEKRTRVSSAFRLRMCTGSLVNSVNACEMSDALFELKR